MRKRFWVNSGLVLSLFFMLACEEDASFDPIPETLMIKILSEMHVADVIVDKRAGPLVMRRSLREDLYSEILEKFDLDRQTFLLHYEYYMEHPSLMNDIYTKVAEDLEQKEEQAKKDYAKKISRDKALIEAARKDSIKKAEEAIKGLPSALTAEGEDG